MDGSTGNKPDYRELTAKVTAASEALQADDAVRASIRAIILKCEARGLRVLDESRAEAIASWFTGLSALDVQRASVVRYLLATQRPDRAALGR